MQGSHETGAAMQRSNAKEWGVQDGVVGTWSALCCGTAGPLVPRRCSVMFGRNVVLLEPVLIQQHRARVYLWAVVPTGG